MDPIRFLIAFGAIVLVFLACFHFLGKAAVAEPYNTWARWLLGFLAILCLISLVWPRLLLIG